MTGNVEVQTMSPQIPPLKIAFFPHQHETREPLQTLLFIKILHGKRLRTQNAVPSALLSAKILCVYLAKYEKLFLRLRGFQTTAR